jgi:hypothetical protein
MEILAQKLLKVESDAHLDSKKSTGRQMVDFLAKSREAMTQILTPSCEVLGGLPNHESVNPLKNGIYGNLWMTCMSERRPSAIESRGQPVSSVNSEGVSPRASRTSSLTRRIVRNDGWWCVFAAPDFLVRVTSIVYHAKGRF